MTQEEFIESGIIKLTAQLQEIVGDVEGFETSKWLARWLHEPLSALGGACPIDCMTTPEGQAMISTLLAQIQNGTYA